MGGGETPAPPFDFCYFVEGAFSRLSEAYWLEDGLSLRLPAEHNLPSGAAIIYAKLPQFPIESLQSVEIFAPMVSRIYIHSGYLVIDTSNLADLALYSDTVVALINSLPAAPEGSPGAMVQPWNITADEI